MGKIKNTQKETLSAQQDDVQLQEQQEQCEENMEISKVLSYLAPWVEKTKGVESIGSWETTLTTKMMVKLLELWITPQNRERIEKMLEFYHPLDRSAMAYALVVYVITGTRMKFKSVVAKQHYKVACQMIKDDMPGLMFTGHMRYMLRRYGKRKVNNK